MGLFSWLLRWRPKVREFADTYVMSRSQLNQNLVGWLPDDRRASLTLLLAHHPETFLQLQDLCNQTQVDYRIHDTKIDADLIRRTLDLPPPRSGEKPQTHQLQTHQSQTTGLPIAANGASANGSRSPVILGLVQQLVVPETVSAVRDPSSQRQEQAPHQASGPSNKLAVLVAERHALRSEDNRVVQFLRRLDHPSELAFFLAFDDPLLGPNLDATVLQLLEHYGMRPDEPLQSQLLERLVRRVQRQHERHAG